MTTGPRQQRKTRKASRSTSTRYATIIIAVTVLIVGIYVSTSRQPQKETADARNPVASLYDEAQEDLKNDKPAVAASKFRQVANIKPGYKDSSKQAQDIAESLYQEAIEHIENEEYEQAQEALDDAIAADPSNEKIEETRDNVNEIIDKQNNDPVSSDNSTVSSDNSTVSSDNSTVSSDQGNQEPNQNNGDSAGEDGGLRPIPEGATPQSLLPDSAAGYRITRSGWIFEPQEAGSAWIPKSNEMRVDIEQVLLTIAHYEQEEAADERFTREKDTFPMEREKTAINGHDAYSGLYNFSGSSEMYQDQQIASLAWTRGNWFFSVQVLPKGTPDNDFKKGIARDVAISLGY